jgi:hypothetical protein
MGYVRRRFRLTYTYRKFCTCNNKEAFYFLLYSPHLNTAVEQLTVLDEQLRDMFYSTETFHLQA